MCLSPPISDELLLTDSHYLFRPRTSSLFYVHSGESLGTHSSGTTIGAKAVE